VSPRTGARGFPLGAGARHNAPVTGDSARAAERASAKAAAWARLLETADAVRVDTPPGVSAASGENGIALRRVALIAGALAAAAASAILATHLATPASADATADQDLFSLTNQDRASNGLHALLWHSTLSAIGESKPYGGCGFNVNGRSYDMIQRNYFAHPILNCGGQYVFSMMSADGVNYRSAGENIGWDAGTGDAASSASYINQQFMNSTEHRDNILNTGYTHLGIGTDFTSGSWSGSGTAVSNVWMFSEEFAQLATTTAPPPSTPKPAPKPPPPTAPPSSRPPPAATPAPTAPPTAVATALPTPPPTPTPVPTPTPETAPPLGAPPPPLVWSGGGLIADSIESVLEAFLVD